MLSIKRHIRGITRNTYNSKSTKYTVEELLNAIEQSNGFISDIARILKCSWHTADKAINDNQQAKELLESKSNEVLDIAESNVFNAIKDGDMSMSKWILTTPKAKKRGYRDTTSEQEAFKESIIELIYKDTTARKDDNAIFAGLNSLNNNEIRLLLELLKNIK